MVIHRFACAQAMILGLLLSCCSIQAHAQQNVPLSTSSNSLEYKIRPGSQRVSMYVNSSKILSLEGKQIPRALVNNPELVNAIAISANQIQLSGLKAGVTQINLWDEETNLYTIDVIVYGDSKELELLLETEFPNASLRVRPLATSVVLSGWVDGPEVVSRVIRMAEDYYPKVINNIRVGDNQQVQLHVQVMEVSRTKLRNLGVDWAAFGGDGDFIAQSVSGLLTEITSGVGSNGGAVTGVVGTGLSTMTFGLVSGDSNFFGVVDALRQNDLVKVLAEPVLTTVSGRPAAFNAGGEFPVLIPQGLGTLSVEYKKFGTRVDFVPIVLGNGNIRLEVRPQVSEIDNARGVDLDGTRVPGLRNRWVDTAVEMRAGQTLALAGLIQDRVEAQNRGIPVLAELPWAGVLFRRVVHVQNEIELLVMVRPEFVDAMNPDEVPMFGPGEHTTIPSDKEAWIKGYMEVPTCCPDGSCLKCRAGRGQFAAPRPNAGVQAELQNATPPGLQMRDIRVISDEPVPASQQEGSVPTPAEAEPSGTIDVGPVIPEAPAPLGAGVNAKPQPPAGMPFGMRRATAKNPVQNVATKSVETIRRMAAQSRWGK